MKKILFVINTMGRAGAEMALLELLRILTQKDVEVSLYVLTGQGEMIDRLPEKVKLLNKDYRNVSVHTPEGKRLLMKTSLKALFRRGNVFRLFPYMIKNFFVMLKNKRILPDKLLWRALSDGADYFDTEYDLAIAYIEGGSAYYVADHVKAKKKAVFFHINYEQAGYTRDLDKDCYLQYDKVFPISQEGLDNFLRYYPECKDKTQMFHNLINAERIKTMSAETGGFTDDFDGYRILSVGRLVPQKEFEHSIKAMRLLKDKGIRARWYILGEGELREELEQLIHKLELEDAFFLLGVTDNPYTYMAQADIYVHATRFEGKSIAIQEAQILERPILVSDCSGNREQVEHGIDGLICNLTPEDICTGVQELLADMEKAASYGVQAAKRHKNQNTEIEKILSLL